MTLFVHRNAGGRCPCGAENAACGPPSDVVPADQMIEEVAAVSGPLRKYRVTRNGFETVMKLNDADAAKLKAGPYQVADAVSTVEPVTPVGTADNEPPCPGTAAAVVADAGAPVSEGLVEGLLAVAAVQPVAEPGGDGQTSDVASAPGSDPGDGQAPAPAPAPVTVPAKAPAKKRTTAANKARTPDATKAPGAS